MQTFDAKDLSDQNVIAAIKAANFIRLHDSKSVQVDELIVYGQRTATENGDKPNSLQIEVEIKIDLANNALVVDTLNQIKSIKGGLPSDSLFLHYQDNLKVKET